MTRVIGIGLVALILFILQRQIYRKIWNRSLYVKVFFTKGEMYEGDKSEIHEIIENRKHLPLPILKVKFQTSRHLSLGNREGSSVTDLLYWNDIFHVGGGEKITRILEFTAKKRGYYKITGVDLVSADLFLTTEMVETRMDPTFLYVYPKPFLSREFWQSLQQLNGEVLSKRHLIEDPFEYRGIREYQPYDDMRSVNWKATARTGELKVNQKNYTSLQTIRIFFNTEDTGILKKEEAVEMTFRITAGIAQYFLDQGMRIAVYGNGVDIINGDIVSIEAGAGNGQMDQICKALARIDTAKPIVPFCETFEEKLFDQEKGVRTIFVSPNLYQDFERLLLKYYESGKEFDLFYPYWGSEPPVFPEWLTKHLSLIPIREEIQ